MRLDEAQVAFYREHGFLAVDALAAPEEVGRLVAIYDDLFARRVGREQGDHFDLAGADDDPDAPSLPQILGPHRWAPELVQGALFQNAWTAAKQILGEDAVFTGDHAILKPPRMGVATPWHQDEAYWDPALEYHALSVWIPLQAVDDRNGCMCFVPGSHRLEVQPHHSIGHDPRVHGLEIDGGDMRGAVSCPLTAGGATFHDSRTLHYTGPNLSDAPRRAYILGFARPALPRTEPRDFYWNRQKQTAREARARESQGLG